MGFVVWARRWRGGSGFVNCSGIPMRRRMTAMPALASFPMYRGLLFLVARGLHLGDRDGLFGHKVDSVYLKRGGRAMDKSNDPRYNFHAKAR